ncbi:AI-2E family transporter [Tenacibaculum sp. AHE15PA]|uniref:AI-2E family transporter n=1 Tax=unclassified Tenacibaculum TaxID=2635139 RepID=UPI001C4EBD22|nr:MULTISPECIES: AI-2E family transporter [unclassified Tenacibaculum]QXP74309.1 AI-2E family transporter [Tenacibaculum sp. AHE14PA]QXP75321.1 AI-2E family transporter [Tenacibaculum sp. AHE15PA]
MENNLPSKNSTNQLTFKQKTSVVIKYVVITVGLILLIQTTFRVFLLVLAGTLIALVFRGISDFIQKKTNWKDGICVAISIITILILFSGLFWLIGAKVQSQTAELMENLPQTIDTAKSKLQDTSIGKTIIEELSSEKTIKKAQDFAGGFFKSSFGVFGDLYVVLFIGIFFTVSPKIYTKGIVQLMPIRKQNKAKDVLNKLGAQLRNWLKGKLLSMLIVFVLTAIGLAVIGIPLWLVLAFLAGLISFIPNFGPIIALIPAVLLALSQSPEKALIVIGLYMLIQFIESNFITILIQKKLINMPPALIIISQLVMGILTGGWGLVLATPITVIVIVLVQQLYIKPRNAKVE